MEISVKLSSPRTPKLTSGNKASRSHWYPYYAGYSPGFVEDMLELFGVSSSKESVVLDPWNGSGTTTTICAQLGIGSAGFDINPAMIVVAKARLLSDNISQSLAPLLRHILVTAKSSHMRSSVADPLRAWFDAPTSSRLRRITNAIRDLLTVDASATGVDKELSSLAAFYFVLLFRLVRRASRGLAVSNPTWVRRQVAPSERIVLSFKQIEGELINDLTNIQLVELTDRMRKLADADVGLADSQQLPVSSRTISTVISSPPYCTRIDYAASTRMELAVLGVKEDEVRALRIKMLGTTLSSSQLLEGTFPDSVNALLHAIRCHESKASATYYLSTYMDYFSKLRNSISEIARVSKVGCNVALVVQESAYKGMRVDLAAYTTDLMTESGFSPTHRWDFQSPVSMGNLRNNTGEPIESVLAFRRS